MPQLIKKTEIEQYVGHICEPTDWFEVTQEQVNVFAGDENAFDPECVRVFALCSSLYFVLNILLRSRTIGRHKASQFSHRNAFWLTVDTFGMTERLKAFDAMIGPHTTGTDTAKGQVFLQHMEHHIIDRDAARGGAREEALLLSLVVAKVVGGQRARPIVDIANSLFEVLVGFNRQQWPKDFILHTDGIIIRVNNQRRWKLLGRIIFKVFIGRVDGNHLDFALFGIVEVVHHALIMTLINHSGVLVIVHYGWIHRNRRLQALPSNL